MTFSSTLDKEQHLIDWNVITEFGCGVRSKNAGQSDEGEVSKEEKIQRHLLTLHSLARDRKKCTAPLTDC